MEGRFEFGFSSRTSIYSVKQTILANDCLFSSLLTSRYFGTWRVGSNLIPDDINGLPSTLGLEKHLAANKNVILYEAEIDQGKAFRCFRLVFVCFFTPWGLAWLISQSVYKLCTICTCDEMCCWVRKEYSSRSFFRIYSNRIEVNEPQVRFPFGYLGCGSWNSDKIVVNVFDRGAFGFQPVRVGVPEYLCCCWPVYGGVVARHRCQCNGPLWDRMFTDCGRLFSLIHLPNLDSDSPNTFRRMVVR